MLEIFRALRALQFEWKIVAQYSLKCRPCSRPHLAGDGSAAAAGHPLKRWMQCRRDLPFVVELLAG